MRASWLALGIALCLLATPLAGQRMQVEGAAADSASELLRQIVQRANYRLIDRDTILTDTLPHDLIVVRSDVRLEGAVLGDVAIIQGVLFLRPASVITGRIAEIEGRALLSTLGSRGEIHSLPAVVRTEVEQAADGYRVGLHPPPAPRRVALQGAMGLQGVAYDRVNGLTVAGGVRANLTRDTVGPRVLATGLVHTARTTFGGEVALEIPGQGTGWLVARAGSRSLTNDAWMRGELANSAAALVLQSDARDYFDSDFISLSFLRRQREPLIQGESFIGPRVTIVASRDASLEEREVWSIRHRDRPWRINPSIDDGTIVSVIAGARGEWRGVTSRFSGDAQVEWAPPSVGDFEFGQARVDAAWQMLALWGHTIYLYGHGMAPVHGSAAPRQRWSFVGGSSTIPTESVARFRGDHLAFIESVYVAPLPYVNLPVVGPPSLRIHHAMGGAWVSGEPFPGLAQSLGVGLQAAIFHATVYVDPADPGRPLVLGIGTAFQRGVGARPF